MAEPHVSVEVTDVPDSDSENNAEAHAERAADNAHSAEREADHAEGSASESAVSAEKSSDHADRSEAYANLSAEFAAMVEKRFNDLQQTMVDMPAKFALAAEMAKKTVEEIPEKTEDLVEEANPYEGQNDEPIDIGAPSDGDVTPGSDGETHADNHGDAASRHPWFRKWGKRGE